MDPGYQPELGKGKGTAKGEIPNFSKTILQRHSILASCGCHDKSPEMNSLPGLEARGPESICC